MIADPKSKAFRDGFISQWAEFDRYDAITIDNSERHHIRFNEGVQQDAKREVREFFGALIDENLPVANFIDADFVTINSALAAHYGIDFPPTKTDEFRKIRFTRRFSARRTRDSSRFSCDRFQRRAIVTRDSRCANHGKAATQQTCATPSQCS